VASSEVNCLEISLWHAKRNVISMGLQCTLTGLVIGVYVNHNWYSPVATRHDSVVANFGGFEGDKHYGMTRLADSRSPTYPRGTEIRNDRQVSVVSDADLQDIAKQLEIPEIWPEWLGANLLIQNIPHLSKLAPLTKLCFPSGAVLIVQHENLPCTGPGKVMAKHFGRIDLETRFPKAALHKRGVVACIEMPGRISDRDKVIAEVPQQTPYPGNGF
jgi:hypothetical protein